MNILSSYKKFIVNLSAITISLIVILFSIKFLIPSINFPDLTWLILAFFYIFTALVHLGLLKAGEKRAVVFIRVFMLATFLKLMIYLGFVLVLIYFFREDAAGIAILFMVLYLVFTSYEIIAILSHFRLKDKQNRV